MADTRDQLQLPEIDLLTKVVKDFEKSTTSIFDDIENIFPTAPILDKQKDKEQVIVTPDAGMGKLLKLNKNLLEVTENDVVGSIEELTELFKDGIPMDSGKGAAPAVDLGASFEDMLTSIQSIEKGSDFTQRPEFLQFMEEQNEQASELLKGTEEERAIAFEMLAALGTLSEDNKESINTLMKQQKKAEKRSFKDVGRDIAGKIPGFGSLRNIGIKEALEGALIAGIAGWEIGKRLETWMNDNWQIRDLAADFFGGQLDVQGLNVTADVAATKIIQETKARTDIGEEEKLKIINLQNTIRANLRKQAEPTESDFEKAVLRIGTPGKWLAEMFEESAQEFRQKLKEVEAPFIPVTRPGVSSVPITPEVKSFGSRIGNTKNIERGMDNRTHQTIREEVVRGRQPVTVKPQTTVIPIPAPPIARPAPQKQIDDFGSPMMHLFLQ